MTSSLSIYAKFKMDYILWHVLGPDKYARVKWMHNHVSRFQEELDDRKIIFIHIPKTAGTSIAKALTSRYNAMHYHFSLMDYYAESCQKASDYFKFSVVRNPWDRMVSAYHYLRSPPEWCGERTMAFSYHFIRKLTFHSLVHSLVERPWLMRWHHFRPQFDFVSHQGRVDMDMVLRFESLDTDMRRLCDRIDISLPALTHENPSKHHGNYRKYYTDEMVEIVGSLYRNDILAFGYEY